MIIYKYSGSFYIFVLQYFSVILPFFMRFIMSFSKNLNKLLLIGTVLGITGNLNALEGISYHSIEELKPEFLASLPKPKCDAETLEKLRRAYDQNTKDIFEDKKTLSELIKDCKKVFFNTDDDWLYIYEGYEEDIEEEKSVQDRVKEIIEVSEGLPEAASRLQALYEQDNNLEKSLLWGLVACYLGIQSAPESVGRILLLMKD